MDKVDRSVSRIQGCRRVDWPLVGALLASFWVSRSCSWGSRLTYILVRGFVETDRPANQRIFPGVFMGILLIVTTVAAVRHA